MQKCTNRVADLFKIQGDGLVSLLEVALVGVEHNCPLRVVGHHHLHGQPARGILLREMFFLTKICPPMDGWLEVGLLSIDHHPHVLLLGILEDLV